MPLAALAAAVRRPSRLRAALAVAALAFVAAMASLVLSQVVFPYPSGNPDEAVYLLQADALRHSRLFPPAPGEHAEAFQPFFTRHRGEVFVPKYSPIHAGFLAAGRIVFGTYRAGIVMIAGGLVVATYLLGREVLQRRREALLAAGFLVASPLFLVQSTTYLSYLSALLLLELFAVALLRGRRLESVGWHIFAGFLFGLAFFARSYDALLFGVPFGVLFAVAHRRRPRDLLLRSGALLVGLTPVLVAYAAFNVAATGHALHPPFALDPTDAIGFGAHRLVPGDPYFDYTPRQGLVALSRYLSATSFWVFGGVPIVGFAVAALARRRRNANVWALAAVAVVVPVGYFFFWGMSVSSVLSGGIFYLGPWYYTPLFGPLVILGAAGFTLLWRRERGMAVAATVVMIALSSFVAIRAFAANAERADTDRRLHRALEVVPARSLVFLPTDMLLTRFPTARNPTLDGPVLYAVDRGPSKNLAVARSFPSRDPYLLQFPPARGETQPPSRLRPLRVLSGSEITIPIHLGRPLRGATLTAEWRGRRIDCTFGTDATSWSLRVTSSGVRCAGATPSTAAVRSDLAPDYLFLTILEMGGSDALYRWIARVDTSDGDVFLTPPLASERNELSDGRGVGAIEVGPASCGRSRTDTGHAAHPEPNRRCSQPVR